jgi:lipoate-protein ligase A
LPTPEENLALDEALLLEAEEHCSSQSNPPYSCSLECLRFWESSAYFVVLGAGGHLREEAHWQACKSDAIPILRRDSGGGTVLQGPGCLNYTLVLDTRLRPECADIAGTNRYVLEKLLSVLRRRWPEATWRGTSDLALGDKKFCGTAQRRKRRHILFHGAILYDFDLDLMERYLKHPPKEPDYRGRRPHREFVTNLDASPSELRSYIAEAWGAEDATTEFPAQRVRLLVAEKYSRPEWNEKF